MPGSVPSNGGTSQPTKAHWLASVGAQAGAKVPIPAAPDPATLRRAWATVVEACKVSDEKFVERVAAHFRIGVADLSTWDPQAVRLVPEAVARKFGIVALSHSETSVVVATADPTNPAMAQEIRVNAGRNPVFLLASPARIDLVLERAYAPARAPKNALQTLVSEVAASDFEVVTSSGVGTFTSFDLEGPAVVKLANVILQQGARYRATEVHVEPGRNNGRVRYRIDGVLQHVVDLPPEAHARLVGRLKLMAAGRPGEDMSEGFPVRGGTEELRGHLLSTPTPDGELVLVRLASTRVPSLDELGFDGPEGDKIREVLRRRDGLVLVTGPARSGTTSFVHACLSALDTQNVISLEGRIEAVLPRVTQIRYEPSSGRSFAESLQQLLDRNPDVLHAGEIRDLATARIVIRTAVTGRKIFSTVHTSDAVSGLGRLTDMGIDGGRLGESCHAVISLRLVRRLCDKCKTPVDLEAEQGSRERKLAEKLGVRPGCRPGGCNSCAGTGYVGQIPLVEVLVMNLELRSLLEADASEAELLEAARRGGMRTFSEIGVERVANGETTIEELERVLGVIPLREENPAASGPVLVAEDDPQDRVLIRAALDRIGFSVLEAENGKVAMELLQEDSHDFSLVILDLNMPEMGGMELLRGIRSSLSTQTLPVMVLTSSPDPRHEIELLEAGADDYLPKPVAVERVEARVRALLRRNGKTILS